MATETTAQTETALIPAGAFLMGDYNGRPSERPAHRVWVSAFRLALLPATNRDYGAFLAATGHEEPRFWNDAKFNVPRQPVTGVSWHDAVAYCDWLSEGTGLRYRLPTEAEREKASRGGLEGAAFPWGDDAGGGAGGEDAGGAGGNASGRFPQDAPWEVGRSEPNGYGLLDMAYNVHEWCSDWFDREYYASSPERDPQGPRSGTRRASRGGAWRHDVKVCRCAARSGIDPSFRYNDYGFRVALQVD